MMPVERLLQELIRIPSPSGNEGEIAKFVRDYLSSLGVDSAVIDELGNVIAVIRGSSHGSIVLEGHLDTVDVGVKDDWVYDPFEGRVIDGKVYGRGAVDMKGPIAAQIAAVDKGINRLNSDLYLIYTVHEESAEGVAFSHALERYVRHAPVAVVIGEATSLNVGIGHRGRAVIKVEVRGITAHASMPKEGLNALIASSKFITMLEKVRLSEHPLLGKENLTPTIIKCSPEVVPQIPDICITLIDARIVLNTDTSDIIKRLDYLCDIITSEGYAKLCRPTLNEEELRFWTGKKLRVREFFPAWINTNEGVINKLINALRQKIPNTRSYIWRFSTDGVYSAGVKGYFTLGFGPGNEYLAHKPNEYIEIRELRKAVEGYRLIIKELDKYLSISSG